MAMARPPSVIVLIDRPAKWNTTAVARIETGMAVSEIAVVRTFSRNANSTTATTTIGLDAARARRCAIERLDEVRLPEQDLVGLDAARQGRGDLLQRRLDLAGEL